MERLNNRRVSGQKPKHQLNLTSQTVGLATAGIRRERWLAEAQDADSRGSKRPVANELLAGLPADMFKRLRPYLKEMVLEKDEYLYQQDDHIDSVYFPDSAVISEFQILEDGRTIEVAITGPEGAVGVTSAFSVCTATSCTQICVPGTVWKIKSDVLEREIAADRELNRLLHAQINANIRQLSQKIICNTYHSLEQRFCTWLLAMTERCGTNKLQVTQEHVARVLGVHRPSVTYIAQALRDLKLIDYRRGRIIVSNREGLKDHACPCYSDNGAAVSTPMVVSASWPSAVKH